MAIIRCPQCNGDVSDKAKNCPHCNYQLNKYDEVERLKNSITVSSNNNRTNFNQVAKKFNLVVMIMKVLGYFSAFVGLIGFIGMSEFWWGVLWCIVVSIVTWLSTLIFEAIAEGLNLLQEIRDK